MTDEVNYGTLLSLKYRLYARLVELLSAGSFQKEEGLDDTYCFQVKSGKCFLLKLTSTLHYDGDVPSISEDIYAVARLFVDHVRAVAGACIGQIAEESSFTVDKIESDSFGLKWGEALYMGGHIRFAKDAKGFHLRWATNAEVDIGNADGDALHRHE